MKGILLVLWSLGALLHLSSQTEYMHTDKDICRLFPDGTVLREPGFCDRSIVCQNSISTPGTTCPKGQFFNLLRKACYSSLEKTDTYCKSPCTAKTDGYVGDSIHCGNWHYCNKATTLGSGTCPSPLWFDEPSQQCVQSADTICVASFELCQVVPTGTSILDENNCDKYITCSTGTAKVNSCAEGMYYDVKTGSCIRKALVKCKSHPLPVDVCGNKKLAKRNKFVADGATCRGYFYCHDLGSGVPDPNPIWQQCPLETFFNEDIQFCQSRNDRKCTQDRCDGREDGYELLENIGCKHYVKCVDGAEQEEFECEGDTYFDMTTQKCTADVRRYGACSV